MNKLNNCFGLKRRFGSVIRCLALAGMILMLTQSAAFAAPPTPDQVAQSRAESRAMLHTYYAWLNAPWTDDDRPYQRIRTNIEQEISGKANPLDLLKKYQRAFEKAPGDPQTQFAYYYAAYKAAISPEGGDNAPFTIGIPVLGNLFLVVIRTPPPHTYNYVRLAFLCEQYGFVDPNLKTVGLRLVGHDPSDYYAKYYTISSLALSSVPADHALALTYAHELLTNYPNKPSSHGIAASLHYQSWLKTKSKQEANIAISEFQKYLQLEPKQLLYRKQVEKYITQMQNS